MSLSQFHYVLLHRVGLHLFPFFDLSFYFSIKFKCPKNGNNFWGSIITPVSIYVSIIRLYIYILHLVLYCTDKKWKPSRGREYGKMGQKELQDMSLSNKDEALFSFGSSNYFFLRFALKFRLSELLVQPIAN